MKASPFQYHRPQTREELGTMLDVSDDLEIGEVPAETPDVETYALYAYLSSLLGEMVDALDPG